MLARLYFALVTTVITDITFKHPANVTGFVKSANQGEVTARPFFLNEPAAIRENRDELVILSLLTSAVPCVIADRFAKDQ